MTTSSRKLKTSTTTNCDAERVLLLAAEGVERPKILGELDSVMEERFQVEWVTELSSGIDRLDDRGVKAAVVGLNPSGSQGTETIDKVTQAAPDGAVLSLSKGDTKSLPRQAVENGTHDSMVKDEVDGYRLRKAVRGMMDRQAAEESAESNAIASATLDSMAEAVLITDKLGNLTYLNRFAEKMTGWSREEARGRTVKEVLQFVDRATGSKLDTAVANALQEHKAIQGKVCSIHGTLIRRNGTEIGTESRVTVLTNGADEFIGAVVAIRDVSLALAAHLEISRVAQHDVLTDLPNRTLFNDRLRQAISLAERQHKRLAVLFVDLDQFKRVNDSLGHAVGDKLLRSVASRLKACVRRTDTVCRLGGDEFVILLSQLENAQDAEVCARMILRAVAAPHNIDNKSLDINVSIGGSTYPADALDAESLMSHADAAMYQVKLHGRNGYEFFRHEMRETIAKRLALEGNLRYALGRNEFILHYQPRVNLDTGQISGMEALIRWRHPEHGILGPDTFVPIAEECGMIVPIGRWVLLEACRQARKWSDAGLGVVPISVNVSAAEFRAKDFLSGVRAVLIATGVEPINLELELTESVLMQDAESALVTLKALKAMGVHLSIDDFGKGHSSFTYLRRFPVDTLKVDRSFVQEITANPEEINLVGAMINIGKSLNQRVVAEGVETPLQLDFLQRHGCSEGQGYYFSRPLPAEEAGNLLQSGLAMPGAPLSALHF